MSNTHELFIIVLTITNVLNDDITDEIVATAIASL